MIPLTIPALLLVLASPSHGRLLQMCAQDMLECPDGSLVARDVKSPTCEFLPCPPPKQPVALAATQEVRCDTDMLECPDGSIVGRDIENNCEFFPCPLLEATTLETKPLVDSEKPCCDPDDMIYCFVGPTACCPNGNWACSNDGVGIMFDCGDDGVIEKPNGPICGQVKEEPVVMQAYTKEETKPLPTKEELVLTKEEEVLPAKEEEPIVLETYTKDEEEPVATTQEFRCDTDVRECPGGSKVGRDTKNNCEFFPCPPIAMETTKLEKEPPIALPAVTSSSIAVCKDGSPPLPKVFCGRGPDRQDCPEGYSCLIDPADRFAICCADGITKEDVEPADVVPDPPCCDPDGMYNCFVGPPACCPNGNWACSNDGEGFLFDCGKDGVLREPKGPICGDNGPTKEDETPTKDEGSLKPEGCQEDLKICPDGSTLVRDPALDCEFPECKPVAIDVGLDEEEYLCCPPEDEPGQGDNPICADGHICCVNTGAWSCGTGDGTFRCGDISLTKVGPLGVPCGKPSLPNGAPGDGEKPGEEIPDGEPVEPEDKCCDPLLEPSKFGNPTCFEGHACCPSTGKWMCSDGIEGVFCDGVKLERPGKACENDSLPTGDGPPDLGLDKDEYLCCPPEDEPGQGDNPICTDGWICCVNTGEWSCGIGDGTFPCGEFLLTEDDGPLGVACEEKECDDDSMECPDGTFVERDPANGCEFPECKPVSTDGPPDVGLDEDEYLCCPPENEPGQGSNPICTDGYICCVNTGEWSCGVGDGTFPCGELSLTEDDGPLGVACETTECDDDSMECPDGSFVDRDPANDCEFTPCPPIRAPDDELPDEDPKDDDPEEEPQDDDPEDEPKDDEPEDEPKDDEPEEEPKDEDPEEEPKGEEPEEPKDDEPGDDKDGTGEEPTDLQPTDEEPGQEFVDKSCKQSCKYDCKEECKVKCANVCFDRTQHIRNKHWRKIRKSKCKRGCKDWCFGKCRHKCKQNCTVTKRSAKWQKKGHVKGRNQVQGLRGPNEEPERLRQNKGLGW